MALEFSTEAWNRRYEDGDTPWDMGEANPLLVERLAEDLTLGLGMVGTALVPGCGRGWDAAALAGSGWRVIAMDLAPVAVGHARALLEPLEGTASVADAFEWDEPTNLLFDHTFFCALPPPNRPRFGDLARRVVAPGGRVISIVFPLDRPPSEGPPYTMSADDVSAVLGPDFDVAEIGPARMIGHRSWTHRWVGWSRVE